MNATTTTASVSTRPALLAKLGYAGIAAAVLGVLSGALLLAWPPQVAEGVLSYPFTARGFRNIQTWFFLHHFLLVAVGMGFARSASLDGSRFFRGAAWMAVLGLAGLTGMELFTIRFATWQLQAANEGVVGAGYGITTNLVGLGMLLAGIRVVRARSFPGLSRFVPLAIGVSHFLLVTPAIFSNHWVAARIAIVTWIALFGALGRALILESRGVGRPSSAARVDEHLLQNEIL